MTDVERMARAMCGCRYCEEGADDVPPSGTAMCRKDFAARILADAIASDSLLAAAQSVVAEHYHRHSKHCYGPYEVCGEHHAHTGPDHRHPCGGRPLRCRHRASGRTINALHDAIQAQQQKLVRYGDQVDPAAWDRAQQKGLGT